MTCHNELGPTFTANQKISLVFLRPQLSVLERPGWDVPQNLYASESAWMPYHFQLRLFVSIPRDHVCSEKEAIIGPPKFAPRPHIFQVCQDTYHLPMNFGSSSAEKNSHPPLTRHASSAPSCDGPFHRLQGCTGHRCGTVSAAVGPILLQVQFLSLVIVTVNVRFVFPVFFWFYRKWWIFLSERWSLTILGEHILSVLLRRKTDIDSSSSRIISATSPGEFLVAEPSVKKGPRTGNRTARKAQTKMDQSLVQVHLIPIVFQVISLQKPQGQALSCHVLHLWLAVQIKSARFQLGSFCDQQPQWVDFFANKINVQMCFF